MKFKEYVKEVVNDNTINEKKIVIQGGDYDDLSSYGSEVIGAIEKMIRYAKEYPKLSEGVIEKALKDYDTNIKQLDRVIKKIR